MHHQYHKDVNKYNIANPSFNSQEVLKTKKFSQLFKNCCDTYLQTDTGNHWPFSVLLLSSQAIRNPLQCLYNNIDTNYIVFSLLLVFRKASGCVDHLISLSKLKYCGTREIAYWFTSYLSNRKHHETGNGIQSTMLHFSHGVPQCSILGPLNASSFLQFTLFADETLLSCIPSNAIYKLTATISKDRVHVH